MVYTLIIKDDKIEAAIESIAEDSFTALDFARAYERLFPEEWQIFVQRYGPPGQDSRYTLLDYFTNRLEHYSQKEKALIRPVDRFGSEKSESFRPAVDEEKKYFGQKSVTVFKKKQAGSGK